EPLLQVEPIHLVNYSVDVVAERRPLRAHFAVERDHLIDRAAEPCQRIGREPPPPVCLVHAPLGWCRKPRVLAPGVSEEAEWTAGGDFWVELAERTGGGIAWIGEHLLAGRCLGSIQLLKVSMREIDLAAHIYDLREIRRFDFVRQAADRENV